MQCSEYVKSAQIVLSIYFYLSFCAKPSQTNLVLISAISFHFPIKQRNHYKHLASTKGLACMNIPLIALYQITKIP